MALACPRASGLDVLVLVFMTELHEDNNGSVNSPVERQLLHLPCLCANTDQSDALTRRPSLAKHLNKVRPPFRNGPPGGFGFLDLSCGN